MYTPEKEPLQAAEAPELLKQLLEGEKDWHAYFDDLRRSDVLSHAGIALAETYMEQMYDAIAKSVRQ